MVAETQSSANLAQSSLRSVGIISTCNISLQEMICLLASEGVSVSQTAIVGEADGNVMLSNLQTLQSDPVTEVIILISRAPSSDIADRILTRVQNGDKPTVICFLGSDERPVWQAGAIPTARLDEAAFRAAAWVRGWDQALVSSRLEDQDEQLAALADHLRVQIGPERCELRGLFSSEILCCEAQGILADAIGATIQDINVGLDVKEPISGWLQTTPDLSLRLQHLQHVLGNPDVAVILVDVVQGHDIHPNSADALADTLREVHDRPLLIAHVCIPGADPRHLADLEAKLQSAGAILVPSNAAAARLAGLLVAPTASRPTQSSPTPNNR